MLTNMFEEVQNGLILVIPEQKMREAVENLSILFVCDIVSPGEGSEGEGCH